MAKKKSKSKGKRRERPPVRNAEYRDGEGNLLTLRCELTPKTIEKIGERLPSAAASAEDDWQRRSEMLFERLAVGWEIAGLPIEDQKMLLGRYRMADAETREWVRRTIDEHLREHIPGLADG